MQSEMERPWRESIDTKFGVLQGGMLSPKLLTEFLTDLHRYLSVECGVLMSNLINSYILFADDLILCSEMPEGLQRVIDGLYHQYCSNWHLILSLTKKLKWWFSMEGK